MTKPKRRSRPGLAGALTPARAVELLCTLAGTDSDAYKLSLVRIRLRDHINNALGRKGRK